MRSATDAHRCGGSGFNEGQIAWFRAGSALNLIKAEQAAKN